MNQIQQKHTIRLMKHITEKEYSEISQLQEICYQTDKTNLKLELDFKLHQSALAEAASCSDTTCQPEQYNEFLYYREDTLVSYLGISCFGENIGEINGMTHPDWRQKGFFGRLFSLIINECRHRDYSQLLLLADGNSVSGTEFIKSAGGIYEHSEYRMKLGRCVSLDSLASAKPVTLRTAKKEDEKEIVRQNSIFFHDSEEGMEEETEEAFSIDDNAPNITVYMIELSGRTIGKINVEYGSSSAFLFGFGILPAYRSCGYGKAALKETLRMLLNKDIKEIELDVVCTNRNALTLYKTCGFEEMSIMNYYEYPQAAVK